MEDAIKEELLKQVDNAIYAVPDNCETQRFTDQKLSSPIFACRLFVRPSVRIGDISTYLNCMMF